MPNLSIERTCPASRGTPLISIDECPLSENLCRCNGSEARLESGDLNRPEAASQFGRTNEQEKSLRGATIFCKASLSVSRVRRSQVQHYANLRGAYCYHQSSHCKIRTDSCESSRQSGSTQLQNSAGNAVHFEFVGVMDLLLLGVECDKDEVWYDIKVMKTPKERRTSILPPTSKLNAIYWST